MCGGLSLNKAGSEQERFERGQPVTAIRISEEKKKKKKKGKKEGKREGRRKGTGRGRGR